MPTLHKDIENWQEGSFHGIFLLPSTTAVNRNNSKKNGKWRRWYYEWHKVNRSIITSRENGKRLNKAARE